MFSFSYKNKHTYQTHFLCFLNTETRYLNYDTKHNFFFINTKKHVFQQYFLNNNFHIFLNNNFQTLWPNGLKAFRENIILLQES